MYPFFTATSLSSLLNDVSVKTGVEQRSLETYKAVE